MTGFLKTHPVLLSMLAMAGGSGFPGEQNRVPEPIPGIQQAGSMEKDLAKKIELQYLLFLPDSYDPLGKEWPMLLFLHGAGERGNDLELVKKHGPPKIVAAGADFPFVLVSPQCPRGQFWQNDPLLALIDEIVSTYRIDETRIYLTGLSMGGYGTWSLAAEAPERFAAIAPICGGGLRIWALTLANMPVWAFHGARDRTVPAEESRRMIEALKSRGNQDVRLTIYPEAEHDSWTETYDNPGLYEWLLSQQRTPGRP